MAYQEESFIGSGNLSFDIYDSAGAVTGEIDVGNATGFVINPPTTEKKELTGYRQDNYGTTIKSIITKTEQELGFTLTDFNEENLKLAMLGGAAAYTQSAASTETQTITARLGKFIKLDHRKLDPAEPPTITASVEDTDFEVDYQSGRIKAIVGGNIADGASIDVTYDALAITDGYKIDGMDNTTVECLLRLVGHDEANDRDFECIVYKAQIEPSGDISWLTGEGDFAALEFKGKILSVTEGNWDVIFY